MGSVFLYNNSDQPLTSALHKIQNLCLNHQFPQGFWWYTLEANESIGAGLIQLMHWTDHVDLPLQEGLVHRILSQQRDNGSWSLFYEGPSDLSTTVECYFSLKLAGLDKNSKPLLDAKRFILSRGGLEKVRAFTRIHLALFGLMPWSSCPAMPVGLILFPHWFLISIYKFSSWARACIIPLLILLDKKPIHPTRSGLDLEELFVHPKASRDFSFPRPSNLFGRFFIYLDRFLKRTEKWPWHPFKETALKKCEDWIRLHLAQTEDIYPFMAYSILALTARARPWEDPSIQKGWRGLLRFQQWMPESDLDPLPDPVYQDLFDDIQLRKGTRPSPAIHQQCCISPIWDTPWMGMALIDSGLPPDHPALKKAAHYLISKQVTSTYGDWSFRVPGIQPGGWSFEFQNEFFPDIDDAIQVVHFLLKTGLPDHVKTPVILRALDWILAMQCKNGGWAAFDKDNTAPWVNKIPFSDHKACLDPPTPDITGRMLELLSQFSALSSSLNLPQVTKKALNFLYKTQEVTGAWRGRWGVNYIYGTWCVLKGLASLKIPEHHPMVRRALAWLAQQQRPDGGWGESCTGDMDNKYVPLGTSLASQTAWALMGLMSYPDRYQEVIDKGIQFFIETQQEEGNWKECHHTGTGFPGHFYIRYHGYRHYFPLMALGQYQRLTHHR